MGSYMYFLSDKVDQLSKDQKIFFAFACVERVVQVFEYNYDETITAPREAVDNVIHMLAQDNLDIAIIDQAKKTLEKDIPNVERMGSEYQPSMTAGVAILYAIDSILISEKENVVNALEYALEAVDSFSEFNEEGYEEEKEWHRKAFNIVKQNDSYPVDMIEEINKELPRWSAEWRD